ncbi:MAG: hypothetical protein ACP5MK_01970 [Candidatus Micrarchaeia archaeon]
METVEVLSGGKTIEKVVVGGKILDSKFEGMFAEILLSNGVNFEHESMTFTIPAGAGNYYMKPDFVTDMWIKVGKDLRRVSFETHTSRYIDVKYVDRYMLFLSSECARENYLVLIFDKMTEQVARMQKYKKYRSEEFGENGGEIWIMPYNVSEGHEEVIKEIDLKVKSLLRDAIRAPMTIQHKQVAMRAV